MKKIAVIAVALVAALVVSATSSPAKTSDASRCEYAKLFRGWQGVHGVIYLRLTITPRKPTACRTWAARYFRGGGRVFRKKLGTGVRLCKLLDKTSSQTVTVGVFADQAKAGRTFCRKYAPSWPRV